ncbi:DnaJ -like protein subfamily C member 13 [Trichinella sp. T8]|nr:DnaJ -like protein subfamily C member 13 [Trichinella sp. T8]
MDGINNEILCFMVVKRSWKGRYRRLLAIGPDGYSTYNPANLHLTNHWVHSDVIALKPCVRGIGKPDEFSLMVRIRSKPETFRFCSEETVEILTDILRVKRSLSEHEIDKNDQWEARKVHWSGSIVPIALEASTYGLLQLNKVGGEILAEYSYKDILCIYLVSDVAGAFIICSSPYRRLHMFRCADVEKLIKRVEERSMENIGIACKVNANSVVESFYKQNRLGLHNIASHLTSIVEFNVTKVLARHPEPVRRLLCLSEACLIERDVSTYNVVTLKPLTIIVSLIRCDKDPHLFYIEYSSGRCGVYISVERDDLLASILDGVRSAGNVNVHVGMRRKNLALRWAPSCVPVDTESKLTLMKFITSSGMSREEFLETLRRFNSNIPYGGSFLSSFKEKQIVNCILAIVDINTSDLDPVDWEEVFQALRRLFASKVGFHAFTAVAKLRDKLGNLIVSALKLHNSAVSFAAVEVLCSLMQPLHDGFELRQEQANKSSLLSSPTFLEYLLDMMLTHVQQNTGTLVVAGMLDFLTYALCAPYSETTLPEQFDYLLQMVAKRGRILYRLFQSPSLTIVKSAGLVMRAIIEEAEAQLSSEMQEFALSEGAYLRHLYFSLFTVSSDIRMMAIRQLSRRLIALWTAGSFFAIDLLKRILPEGLMQYLKSNEELPLVEEDLLATRGNLDVVQKEKTAKLDRKNILKEQLVALQSTVEKQVDSLLENWLFPKRFGIRKAEDATMPPVALRKRRIRVTVSENWNMLFHMFNKNHYQSNLIWNPKTRDDLKVALENEIRAFDASQAIQTDCHISWNHFDFEVIYSSLKDEIRIDNNYLRVFIEEHYANNVSKSLTNPKNFFNEVYHGYLTGANQQMRCLCLKALSVTYSDYFSQVGTFSDTKHFVLMLQNCCDLAERDALIDVIGKLCHFKENVKQIIMAGGVELLVDMISLAHLSAGKTSVGFEQSNIIQCSETMKRDDSKEWYCLKEGESEKCGPYSFHHMKKMYKYGEIGKNTKIWGSGMDEWKPLESVAQFRWTLVASGTAQMNETKLAVKILDILLRMIDYFPSRDLEGCIIRPPSKVKQILASSSCLPHIVQLFLTFDPDIVARTAKLLKALIQDSPVISKLYLTGLYYFALMYSGSNIMPIAELFHCSHKMQAFCSVKNGDTVAKRSILYSLLPEAAIFCLENYGAEKYAEIFLSEFDNPEVIWNSEMRRYLIGKIAAHVCDFTVRLPSNVKTLYRYCPLPKINYAQLENEMFCHIYYLRNLCDRDRFPNWTIVNPVEFLQSCLIAWKEEVKKKAPPMSIAEACEILELNYEDVCDNLSVVRKAYYKLAQKYHPDKNPHGREQFEKLNSAYELLASSPCNLSNTDSTVQRIVLCMRAQSLAFQIHTPIFEQYKYSGYQLLIQIIQMESEDEALFSKDGILLIRATELCCSTVECAPLNVEQLRRDNGLEVLHRAFSRCAGVIGETTKAEDLAAMVCLNICQTFAFAAKFEECRAVFSGWSSLSNEFQHIMHFRHLLKLCCSVVRCISLMCESEIMQDIFFESGIMYNLISNLFLYDCTLNSSEIQLDTEINLQCQENIYANDSCECLQSMVGLREGLNRHEKAAASIRALLSPYILHLFQSNLISNILNYVNSNIETPCFIWNGAMKVELFDYIASAEVALRSGNKLDDTKFSYKALENELCIDDVFVRVFNVSNWKNVPHINSFCRKLLDFIVDESSSSDDLQLALDAVLKLLKANQHLELHCVDVLEFLLPLLIAPRTVRFYRQFMDIFNSMVGNEQCLDSIVMIPKWYVPFIQLCDQQFNSCFQVLDMFQSLASINDAVDQLLKSGCGIYFLMLFSSSQIELEVRCKVTQLLAKLQTNRLHGPRWQRFISKLLPPIFTMYMKDSAASAVTAFDCTYIFSFFNNSDNNNIEKVSVPVKFLSVDSQNPELVWNNKLRSHARKVIENLTVEFLDSFADADPAEQWTIPPDVQFDCTKLLPDECVVGGISIRLFVTNPTWPLRNSKQFLIDLFAAFLSDVQTVDTDDSVVEHLQLVTKAMTLLLHVHADLCDYVASLDYLPSIVQLLSSSNREVFKASLYLIYEISKNMICAEKFGETDCMRLFYAALQNYPDMRHLTSQNLKTLLQMGNEVLLAKAVNCQLHRLLLELLGSDLPEVDDPLATKAEIVTALNTLAASNTIFGNEVNAMLNRSAIWNDYRGQNHDLFITQPTEMNFLTDADRSNASLTYQENPKNINEPPPPAAP